MQAVEILDVVSDAGGLIWLEGERVHARLPEALRPLVETLREHKFEIVELLAQRPPMPAGVRLLRWEPKDAPVQVSRCVTVLDVDKFTRSTLQQVAARLSGKGWMDGGWTLSTLIDRLANVGCYVKLEDRKAGLQ